VLRLTPATSGAVIFGGRDVLGMPRRALRRARRHVQIIFQDPAGSLNPRMRIGEIVGEGLLVHRLARGKAELRRAAADALQRCGLPASIMDRYPHQFSGGQRQRIAIARAIALRPGVSSLDRCFRGATARSTACAGGAADSAKVGPVGLEPTRPVERPADFKSAASASSATGPALHLDRRHCRCSEERQRLPGSRARGVNRRRSLARLLPQ
jgi:hypothetical protein